MALKIEARAAMLKRKFAEVRQRLLIKPDDNRHWKEKILREQRRLARWGHVALPITEAEEDRLP